MRADERALAQARSALHATRLKESSDCAGVNAAGSSRSGSSEASGPSLCASAMQTVSADETADVGIDLGTPVVESVGSEAKSRFTGKIPRLVVEVRDASAKADAAATTGQKMVAHATE